MRLGGNTLRGSNPRSPQSEQQLRPSTPTSAGYCFLLPRGPWVATAAIWPPIYLIRYPAPPRGPQPCPETGSARPARRGRRPARHGAPCPSWHALRIGARPTAVSASKEPDNLSSGGSSCNTGSRSRSPIRSRRDGSSPTYGQRPGGRAGRWSRTGRRGRVRPRPVPSLPGEPAWPAPGPRARGAAATCGPGSPAGRDRPGSRPRRA